jgi:hypothetical protein
LDGLDGRREPPDLGVACAGSPRARERALRISFRRAQLVERCRAGPVQQPLGVDHG